MAYNRSKIMKQAWRSAKDDITNMGYARHQLRELFAYYLRMAWRAAKKAARFAKITAEQISFMIITLECKDRLSHGDFQKLDELKGFHRQAWAREADATKLAA